MTLLTAVCLISMGEFDPETGQPRYDYETGKRLQRQIQPGSVFEFTDDDAELEWLRDLDAVRDPTQDEIDAYNLASGVR